ncbi:hypothetical protein Y032_0403g820 [Ancylostoma ceylanicum]|uniref:Uncharacterized protein n=1 Tax=Ancylostoma ceylanicum TaxID=53326 RepID=A0A016X4S3_9BILA|nr:hypothetical protein Y032_0403g820 [Ancylostoma ceylanicum]
MIMKKGVSEVKVVSSTDGRMDNAADSQSIVIMTSLVMVDDQEICFKPRTVVEFFFREEFQRTKSTPVCRILIRKKRSLIAR